MKSLKSKITFQSCKFGKVSKDYFKNLIYSSKTLQELEKSMSCDLKIFWQKKPSSDKLLKVDITLRFLSLFFNYFKAEIYHEDGIILSNFKRRVWDKNKNFYEAGYYMKPTAILKVRNIFYKVFFNSCISLTVPTTLNDFFPFATIISTKVSSDSIFNDIFSLDQEKTLFIETSLGYLNKKIRKHFKGFKHINSSNKYFISVNKVAFIDKKLVQSNGFVLYENILTGADVDSVLLKIIKNYLNSV